MRNPNPRMIIRSETPEDEDAIHSITLAAFAPASYAAGSEAQIIRELRKHGDLTISLVAQVDKEIAGHIAFSPVKIGGRHHDWFGLGPVAVRPNLQGCGIGSELVGRGLALLKAQSARGCVLLGKPAFYKRFGFQSNGTIAFDGLPTRLVQHLVFAGEAPVGELTYARAFDLVKSPSRPKP